MISKYSIQFRNLFYLLLACFIVAACGYQGVEVFFFEEYARMMDEEKYKGSASRNKSQIEAFEELVEDLRANDTDYTEDLEIFVENQVDASSVAERNDDLHDRSEDQENFHNALARYHSPVIYQDMDGAWRSDEGAADQSNEAKFGRKIGARDLPTALVLTSPANVNANPTHIEGLDDAELAAVVPSVYQDVKETLTHYFITYVLYYPHNRFSNAKYKVPGAFPSPQSFDHDQDIEFALVALRKDDTKPGAGTVELILTTRHGTAHLHHPDSKVETRLRRAFGKHLSEADRTDTAMGPIYQPHAIRHEASSEASFLLDSDGNRMGIHLYSPRFGHALNRASPSAWKKGYGTGLILLPESQSLDADNFDFASDLAAKGIRPYKLLSWTEAKDTYRSNNNVFAGTDSFEMTLTDGAVQQRDGSRKSIIRGQGESEAKSVLPEASKADTPHKMALPHAVLEFFDDLLGDSSPVDGEISDYYLFNPDIEYSSLAD